MTFRRLEVEGRLLEVGQIGFTVDDVPHAVIFYPDMLRRYFLFSPSSILAFLSAGTVRIMLETPQRPGSIGGNSTLYFKTSDRVSAKQEVVSRGATAVSPPHLIARLPDHELWFGFIRDPEGNLIGLMEARR